jgi:3-hydroxybutyrate dehydrogenase
MASSRLALVTGSTSGIGLGIARALASKGHDVMLHGFGTSEMVQSAIQTCCDAAPGVKQGVFHHHGADLCDPDQITDMFRFMEEKYSRGPDILVNNAGIQHVGPIESFPTDKWNELLAANLSASFHTIKLALPGMRERGWGRTVNIASVHGLVGSPLKAAYVAAKHGLVGLTKVVALETAGSGITCNAICPGWVLTPILDTQLQTVADRDGVSLEEAKMSLLQEKTPSKEFVMPNEVGSMVLYLCSDDARQVTGATLTIDGGWTTR